MSSQIFLASLVGIVALAGLGWWLLRPGAGAPHVDYLGRRFQLRRHVRHDGNDRIEPEDLTPEDRQQIEALMGQHALGPAFRDRHDFLAQVAGLQFPGRGMTSLLVEAEGHSYCLAGVEMPGRGRYRYLLTVDGPDGERLVDSFVHEGDSIVQARWTPQAIVYSTRNAVARQHLLEAEERHKDKGVSNP